MHQAKRKEHHQRCGGAQGYNIKGLQLGTVEHCQSCEGNQARNSSEYLRLALRGIIGFARFQ